MHIVSVESRSHNKPENFTLPTIQFEFATEIPMEQNRPHVSAPDSPSLGSLPHPHLQPLFSFLYSPVSSDLGKQSGRKQERWKFSKCLTPYWLFSHASCETSF